MDPSLTTPNFPNHPHLPKRLLLIVPALLILLSIPLIIFFSSNKKTSTPIEQPPGPKPAKSWEIIFEYKPTDQTLTVKSIKIKNTVSVKSPFDFSPYQLTVINKSGRPLYEDNIHINEGIHVDLTEKPPATIETQLPIESVIAIPYLDTAAKIQINKDNVLILEFEPPKKISLNLIQNVEAQDSSCNPLNIVFISDGYSDMNKFHQHVENYKQLFSTTVPYNSKNIFSFKTIDNPISTSLGCLTNGELDLNCQYVETSVKDLVLTRFPDLPNNSSYTKIVVLVDGRPKTITSTSSVAGFSLGVGGAFAVFASQQFGAAVALHEIEGHEIGYLNDRYVSTSINYGGISPVGSNCSTNSQGEQFWKPLGFNTGFQGCTNQRWYAPNSPVGCSIGNPATSTLIYTGPPATAMSAAPCGQPVFDSVEQEWIRTKILIKYSDVSCLTSSPSPSPSPSRSPSPNPSGSITPNPSASVPRISPSPSPSVPRTSASPTTPTTSSNPNSPTQGGPPTSAPPGYYTDKQPDDSPIPYVCSPAPPGTAGQQVQLGYLVCTPR